MLHRTLPVCLLVLLWAVNLSAAPVTVFGPVRYERATGQPETISQTFTALPGPAVLRLVNGSVDKADPADRLSSATVTLNGAPVLDSNDFNKKVHELTISVELAASNCLTVELKSGPEGYLTLELTREVTGPSVTLDANPESLCPGREATLTWEATGADTCTIEPGIGSVAATGSATVSPTTTTTYCIRADSSQGSTNATAVVTVLPEPSAWLHASPAAISSGEASTLSWSCENAQNCSITPDIGTVESTGTLTVTPLQTTTYMLSATGTCGTATAEAAVTVGPGLEVEILSPLEGQLFNRPDVPVQGLVHDSQAARLGVVVDGRPALVDGNRFYANHVPLVPGNNTIALFARDSDGRVGTSMLQLVHQEPERYVEVTPFAQWGTAPFESSLRVDGNFDLIDPVLSGHGPGPVKFNSTEEDGAYRMRIADPGMYRVTLSAADQSGEIFSDEVFVRIVDRQVLDGELHGLWDDMKSALAEQDMEAVVSCFTRDNRDLYLEIFTTLYDDLPLIAANMLPIEMITADEECIKYRIAKEELYGGELLTITHHVYFTRDSDGMWKILRF